MSNSDWNGTKFIALFRITGKIISILLNRLKFQYDVPLHLL